jgi:long-chain acyl-CoA synthetase
VDEYKADSKNSIDIILDRMKSYGDSPAIFNAGREISYREYIRLLSLWSERLADTGVSAGTVVAVRGEFSPLSMALLWALADRRAIAVPLANETVHQVAEFLDIAGVEVVIDIHQDGRAEFEWRKSVRTNALIEEFRTKCKPGLVVFTSGSTGKPKGILHDMERVARKFLVPRPSWRTVMFLMFDHFGGINTFLSTGSYGGVAVCLPGRSPSDVCRAIDQGRATLLPTTPTFLNLLLASGAHKRHDLSSVKLITYGTEVMMPETLDRVVRAFPNAQVKQTYGLSELGVLRSNSESNNSTWVRVGGDGFEVDVRNDILWIRSQANMIGYLNAPSPFDGDGWFCTGDAVEVRGAFMRILGRKSDMINVGGQKVYPAEIESVLLQAPNVSEAAVYAVPHPILGQVIHARISLTEPEEVGKTTERLRKFCLDRIARFKVPMKFVISHQDTQISSRFKKLRVATSEIPAR